MRSPALAVLALTACSSTPPSSGDSGIPLMCTTTQHACGGSCVDLNTDSANCGDCGVACAMAEGCAGGHCYARACGTVTCGGNQVCLGTTCVDRACFAVSCPMGQACAGGACVASSCGAVDCPSDQVCVSNACVEAACVGVLCPAGALCRAGVCASDTCHNGIKDGNETDVDCGGVCPACLPGGGCTTAIDCLSLSCVTNHCVAPTCSDGVRNGDEGDVDCGGSCAACADGRRCTGAPQCSSGSCASGVCQAPSCTDGVKNGLETDKDCGGNCSACATGFKCTGNSDCMSGLCNSGKCFSSQCQNAVKDGAETDVDCGGSCYPCMTGRACLIGTDCLNGVCDASKHCSNATCSDMTKNGTETDVDCGGNCSTCAVGRACAMGTDCVTGVCRMASCAVASCSDAVKNGSESDIDCGGAICPRCLPGRVCIAVADCLYGGCTGGVCPVQVVLATPLAFNLGTTPEDLAVADLDGDGKMDVAASDTDSFDLRVFFGASDGGLDIGPAIQVSNITLSRGPLGIGIGDVNGDNRLDLVTVRPNYQSGCGCASSGNWGSCTVTVAAGAGGRNFLGSTDTLAGPQVGCGHRVGVGRFDADNRADVAAGDEIVNTTGGCGCNNITADRNGALVFLHDMVGNFTAGTTEPLGGPYVTVADVNLDGNLDLIARSVFYSRVRVFLGNGQGTFAPPIDVAVSPGTGEVAVARVDGDNFPDIIVASKSSNRVGVALGVGNGNFLAPTVLDVISPDGVAVADIDGDGNFDLVVGGIGIVLFRGLGNGSFQAPEVLYPELGDVGVVHTGDFNGDGKPDVVCISGGKLWLLTNVHP